MVELDTEWSAEFLGALEEAASDEAGVAAVDEMMRCAVLDALRTPPQNHSSVRLSLLLRWQSGARQLALKSARISLCVALAVSIACGSSPTEPDRHGIPQVYIVCSVESATFCRAPISCDLYPCAPGTPTDVTQLAQWSIDDPSVARVIGPGIITSVGAGNTVLRVAWNAAPLNFTSTYFIPIGVFPGTAPLPTYEYEGMIYDGGAPPRTPLNGALVEILSGLVAGRQTISGNPPDFFPGATIPPPVAGHFAFFGVPSGMYRLRVSKAGFVTQEVDTQQGNGFLNIVLVPQP